MGLGLEGAYGADALSQNLRQRVLDQLQQRQQEFQNSMSLRGADRADRALSQQDELTRLKIQEMRQGADEKNANTQFTLAEKANEAVPAGTVFPTVDRMASNTPILGRLSMVGALQPTSGSLGSTTDVPANPKTGTPPQGRLVAMPEGLTKLPSANQQNVLADNARADRARTDAEALAKQNEPLQEVVGPDGKPKLVRRSEAAGMVPFVKPTAESTVTIQTVDPDTGKPVTRVLTKAEALKQGTFTVKPSAATETRLASAQAVNQTGNDIIAKMSDPRVAATLGPAMGRYNSLRDFIGNPPQEFAELAGQIESFALANMGVHGMRSAAGAEQIKHLLDGRHTPESLAATVRGLNGFASHFMQNEGRTPSGGGAGLSADDLIKKYK